MRLSERIFRLFLYLYPARLRAARGTEMWMAFRTNLEDARRARRPWLLLTLWMQELLVAVTHGHRARVIERRAFKSHQRRKKPGEHVHALFQDFRYAFRALRKSPGFAITVIATLAVGIGASTSMYTVIRGVLLTPLDFDDPEQLYSIWLRDFNNEQSPLPAADYSDVEQMSTAFTHVAGRWSNRASLTGEGEPEEVSVAWVSQNFFETLGLSPSFGRGFDLDEFNSIVISDGLWRRRFGADSSLLGRTVGLGGTQMTVVGVLPAGVNPNVATLGGHRESNDVFRLWPADDWIGDDRSIGWIRVIARADASTNRTEIAGDLGAISRELVATVPRRANTEFELFAVGVLDEMVAATKPYLLTLAAGVGFVFLIACFNVTNLSLVRSHLRNRELAVRAAMGAGRRALARQLLVESAVTAGLGALAGIGLAHLATHGLVALRPSNLPRLDTIQLDSGVVWFAVAIAMAATLIVGLVPAWRATRIDPSRMLNERSATGTRKQHRFANSLIASEVALSLLLLTGSGLLLRTFIELTNVDPGFETEGLMTYSLSSSHAGDDTGPAFLREVINQTRALPGVEYMAFTNRFPFAGGVYSGPYATDEQFAEDTPKPEASFRWVTPDFFDAMGARLLAGRFMTEADGPEVAVVDDVLAKKAWPDQDPVGQRVWTGELGRSDWSIVIGVVQQMRHADLRVEEQETIFMPSEYQVGNVTRAVVRTAGGSVVNAATIRRVVRNLDPDGTISAPRTATDLLGEVLAPTRFAMLLIGSFAGVALLLAAVGIFSVVSFTTRQRTREFGLRMALGESPQHIFRHVVSHGLVVTTFGIVVGLVGVVVLARFVASMLFGVEPLDPVSLTASAGLMVATGVIGGWLPARRAARLDPAATLKGD